MAVEVADFQFTWSPPEVAYKAQHRKRHCFFSFCLVNIGGLSNDTTKYCTVLSEDVLCHILQIFLSRVSRNASSSDTHNKETVQKKIYTNQLWFGKGWQKPWAAQWYKIWTAMNASWSAYMEN